MSGYNDTHILARHLLLEDGAAPSRHCRERYKGKECRESEHPGKGCCSSPHPLSPEETR